MWTGRYVQSGYPFYSCTSCRKEHGFAEVLVSVVQKLGYSNMKLSRDRSGQALSAQGVEARINSRQSAQKGGKFVIRIHRLPLPSRRYPLYAFLLGG